MIFSSCLYVLTHSILGREDPVTLLNSTAELLRALPDNLAEMRRLWVVAIIIACFEYINDAIFQRCRRLETADTY